MSMVSRITVTLMTDPAPPYPPPCEEGPQTRSVSRGGGDLGSCSTPTPNPSPQGGGGNGAPIPSPDGHKWPDSLLPLFAWLSPGFPVGAYAYSHTLEWAVECGDVYDAASLESWLTDVLEMGAGHNDAIFLAHAYRCARIGALAELKEVNELALAFAPSRELLLETSQQGRSFLDTVLAAWNTPALQHIAASLPRPVAYPVAIGIAAAAHDIPLPATLNAYLLTLVQNLVSAAIRLAPIGQTSGTHVVAALLPCVTRVAQAAETTDLDDLGSATFRADLGSFKHETQYTRLFRS